MPLLNSCCCWRSLKQGSLAVGIYSLIYFILVSAGLSWTVFLQIDIVDDETFQNFSVGEFIVVRDRTVETYLEQIYLVLCIIGAFASAILILGIKLNYKFLLFPWILQMPGIVLGQFVFIILLMIGLSEMRYNPLVMVLMVLEIFLIVLNIYCILCVVSYWQKLNSETRNQSKFVGHANRD